VITNRVIPALLMKGNGLYKTYKFKKPKYVGDPINAVRIFNEKEVDEIMLLDIEASKKNREPNYDLLKKFASECFMPLTYGGGINNMRKAEKIFSLGVEKISIQTAALSNIEFLQDLVKNFGSSSIIFSIDVKKNFLGQQRIYSHANKMPLINLNLDNSIKIAKEAGVGEILINSVDLDGTLLGQDLNLIKYISNQIDIPLISLGGVGSINDIQQSFQAGAQGVGVGSFFVFYGPHKAVLITYPDKKTLKNLVKK
jgi:cyclase